MADENLYVEVKIDELTKSVVRHKETMEKLHNKHQKIVDLQQGTELVAEELNGEKNKMIEAVLHLKLLLEEYGISKLTELTGRILGALEGFNVLSSDYTKFSEQMDKYIKCLGKRHEIDNQAAGRLWNNIKMGYYPTDPANLQYIKNALKFPDTQVNLLDPCCGCGKALAQLAEGVNAETYGIELDEARAEEARKRLSRIGKGSFFGSRISHEAFHLLYLNPPYITTYIDGFNVRNEKKFLIDAMYHLMYGGILIYVIPFYRITPDIARILADNFDSISVYKFVGPEFQRFKQVTVLGIRIKKRNGSELAEKLVRHALYPETIPCIDTAGKEIYKLPAVQTKVLLFKGAMFDVAELAEQLKASNTIEKLFKDNALDSSGKRPLLPFTIGQIGLIGGSGLIDGYINCSVPHVLKGQVIKERKEMDRKEDFKGRTTELTEVVVNKMNLKVLTIDGVKTLS